MFKKTKVFVVIFFLISFLKINSMGLDLILQIRVATLFIKNLEQKDLADVRYFVKRSSAVPRDLARVCIKKLNSQNANQIMERISENCEELDLSNLEIDSKQLTLILSVIKRFKRLKYLNLSGNQIEIIDKFSFEGLKRLEIIDLRYNLFTAFNKSDFSRLKNLKTILVDNTVIEN